MPIAQRQAEFCSVRDVGTSIDVLVYPNSPHCDVENGKLGVGDLVDQLCHHEEGSLVEGKSGAGKGSKATEGQ